MICGLCSTFRTAHVAFMFPHWKICRSGLWACVVEARASGDIDQVDRLARKAMGVKSPPMTEETKEKLRQYNEENKDAVGVRAKLKRQERRTLKATLKQRGKEIRRKR